MRALVVVLAAAAALAVVSPATARSPLQTAIALGPSDFGPSDPAVAFERARAAGTNVVRIELSWAQVAKTKPLTPRNPADAAYDWSVFDWQVRDAVAVGLQPLVDILAGPLWAQDESSPLPWEPAVPSLRGTVRPNPTAYGDFAHAAALHYGGGVPGVPRVRFWLASNEPNLSVALLPQFVGNRAVSVDRYRSMLNAFATAVHGVHADNVVVAGALAPFGARTKYVEVVAPLRFLRELVCMSRGAHPRPSCGQRAAFDVWGVQPYTAGGPTHRAANADDVSLGDLPEVRRLLDAARQAKHVLSHRAPQLWVSEFAWSTRPPDPNRLVPGIKLQARWVSEAIYRAWRAGATVFTWHPLRDWADPANHVQAGLYFRRDDSLAHDAPKPALAAFRFPFVAYRSGDRASIWGHTPYARGGRVVIEENAGGGWQRVGTTRADASGVFAGDVALAKHPRRVPRPPAERLGVYRAAVERDAPTSYWPLDEHGTSVARDLVGKNDGRYKGGRTSVPGAISGVQDRAVRLDGRGADVVLGRIGTPRTVELWLKTQTNQPTAAFSNRDADNRNLYLGLGDAVHALAFDTAAVPGRAWITDGRWHHIVYTYEGTTARLYVDGRLDSSSSIRRFEGSADAFVGYDATLRRYLAGSVDEVAIYDHALTAAQVERHFLASGRTRSYADEFAIMDGGTYLRARLPGGAASLPFSLTRVADRYVSPLGL